jgi:hypothetical protein
MPLTLTRRPRAARVISAGIRSEVREAYRKFCEDAIKILKRDIATWNTKPEFKYRVAAGEKIWYVSISVDKKTKAGRIYDYVDRGTGKNAGKGGLYPIYPRNTKALKFDVPTPTKSTPGIAGIPGTVLASGISQQETVFSKKVMHPGIRPRNFTKSLKRVLNNREQVKGFRSVTEAAIKRGLRKNAKS